MLTDGDPEHGASVGCGCVSLVLVLLVVFFVLETMARV